MGKNPWGGGSDSGGKSCFLLTPIISEMVFMYNKPTIILKQSSSCIKKDPSQNLNITHPTHNMRNDKQSKYTRTSFNFLKTILTVVPLYYLLGQKKINYACI